MAPAKRKRKPASSCVTTGTTPPARVRCPACQRAVLAFYVNSHLDLECPVLKSNSLRNAPSSAVVPGLSAPAADPPATERLQVEDEQFSGKSSLQFGDNDVAKTHGSDEGGNQGLEFGEASICAYRSDDDGNEGLDDAEEARHGSKACLNQVSAPSVRSLGLADVANEGCNRGEAAIDSLLYFSPDLDTFSETQQNCGEEQDSGLLGAGNLAMTVPISFLCRPPLPQRGPKGLQVLENFVTLEEEEHLLRCLDADVSNPWRLSRVNGIHWGKSYGNHIFGDAKRRIVSQVSKPMPKFLLQYEERMRDLVPMLKNFFPNEMNSIDYRKGEGHYLKAHMDDRQLSGTVLVNLSLAGTCYMSYTRERGPKEVFRVRLPPRSLQVLTAESRYSFRHGIEKNDILDPRRVSMTFRQSVEAS